VIKTSLSLILGAFLVSACSTGLSDQKNIVPASPVPAEMAGRDPEKPKEFFLTDIGVATLPNNKCGMVLWTLDANRPVPVLRYVSGNNGVISFNRIPFELVRINVSGSGNFGVFETQEFAAGADISVSVDVDFGQGFDGGTYLKRGVIRVERPDEPILLTPVAGLAGCRTG